MDETQPLLASPKPQPIDRVPTVKTVDFDPNGDSENPLDWPKSYKWGVIFLMACMAFTVTFTCIGLAPLAGEITLELEGHEEKSASVLLVTIWELGEAAGPLLIAPLSEVYGRYPVYVTANAFFVLFTVVSALSQSTHILIFARFLTGCAVASNVLNPSIIGDMLPPEERGSAMSTVWMAPLIGGAVGPAVAGAIAQTAGWRQVLWLAALIASACEVAFLTMFRETYRPKILIRRASLIRRESVGSIVLPAIDQDQQGEATIWESIKRPARVFFSSFVLQILALYGAFEFTAFYILGTSIPDILKDIYHLSTAQTGASYLCFSLGASFGILLCNLTIDKIYIRLRNRNNGIGQPEFTLPILLLGAFLLPLCQLWYGWTAQLQWPLPVLLVTVGMQGFFLLVGFVPLMAYVVDAFGQYSASAMTAVIITRCLTSTFLPLAIGPLTKKLGYGWGFVVIGSGLLLLAPLPGLVMRYGKKWREYSIYTRKLE